MHTVSLAGIIGDVSPPNAAATERWSRTIGALSEPTWRRLVNLRFDVVGSGPAAGGMAASLTRIGVRRVVEARDCRPDEFKQSDLLVCANADRQVRRQVATLACLYCRPLLEIVQNDRSGADQVRLLLPGDCPFCGDSAFGEPFEEASSATTEFCIGLAMRMIEDLLTARIGRSLCARVRFDRGRLAVDYPAIRPAKGRCAVCSMSGQADAGMRVLQAQG
jgi:hypothetical protein